MKLTEMVVMMVEDWVIEGGDVWCLSVMDDVAVVKVWIFREAFNKVR